VKAQMPTAMQHSGQMYSEVFDEAMDVLTVFRFARQLALINVVDDFSLRDVWEPAPKRFRVLLSAIINFCRYKEGRVTLITSLKEQQHLYESQRLENVQQVEQKERELSVAQERNSQELRLMRDAERDVRQAQAEVDKLQGQTQCADRVLQEEESKLNTLKARLEEQEDQKQKLREHISMLQSQIADSPEGIEQEIQDLQESVRKERGTLEERTAEKRSGLHRDQVLGKLQERLEHALYDLTRLRDAADAAVAAREQSAAESEELQGLQQLLEARRADETDLEQRAKNISFEHERAKEAHEARIKELEQRRQHALVQHQELQNKRAEEQRHQHQLQTQRLELEAEVAGARRLHESQVLDLQERLQTVGEQAKSYIRNVDGMLLQLGSDGAAKVPGSPDKSLLRPRRRSASPSPARVAVNPLGFMKEVA